MNGEATIDPARIVLEGGTVVRPGDRLIIRSAEPLLEGQAAAIREWLEVHCPGIEFLLIHAADLLVYRPDEVAEADGDRIIAQWAYPRAEAAATHLATDSTQQEADHG